MDDTYTLITQVETEATREGIWNAWRDSAKVAKWWGPEGFTSTIEELDVRPGGKMKVVMHGPDGTNYPNLYIFDEVNHPDQLMYTNQGSEEFGLAPFQSVLDLEEVGGKTQMTLKMRFASQEEKDKHVFQFHADEGSRQLLERLAEQSKQQ